jgi:hypothetical protein
VTTTSSTESRQPPAEALSTGDPREALARGLTRALADHPILPASSATTLRDGPLQQLLADLARGAKSQYAGVLREVGEEQGVPLDEIARRAQFTLACILLPATGTFYEILGVAPDASAPEIREHWTAAIHRYHPDRFGGQNPWLDAQARRLIEAYETLRDPERRRHYDAALARTGPRLHASMVSGARARGARWRILGLRLGILLLVIVVGGAWVWTRFDRGMTPMQPVPVPPSPRLLETWRSQFLAAPPALPGPDRHRDMWRDTGGASHPATVKAQAPEDESKVSRGAGRSIGHAESGRDRRAEDLVGRESTLDSSSDSPSGATPTEPVDVTIDPPRTDR